MNALTAHPTTLVALFATTVGATVLLRSSIVNDDRVRPQWARWAIALSAVSILLFCAATFFLIVRGPSIAPKVASVVTLFKTLVAGMAAGSLITLFMSGSFSRRTSQTRDQT